MIKKILVTVLFVFVSFVMGAQKNINNYKYILVPEKFDFSKVDDEYQLNSITKFLFNKYGYEAYSISDELPTDLRNKNCLALTSEVSNKKSGLFKTKIEITLKDCFGNIVMTSQVGESRLKKYDRAYNQALRNAFETFQNIGYAYTPSENEAISNQQEKIELPKKVEEEVKIKKETSDVKQMKTEEKEIETVEKKESVVIENKSTLYYAQAIKDGYQLVDSEPKIVMVLLSTSTKDVFIVKNKNAIVYKENNQWIYFENNGNQVNRVIDIKF